MIHTPTPPELIALNASLFALFYFLPSLLGLLRQREARLKLFLVNLLTGWTIAGWVVAFMWALSLPWDVGFGRRRGPLRPGAPERPGQG